MARPRKTSGKTSFGKRSDAEKSFRNKKKEKPEGRFNSERPRTSGSKFTRDGDSRPGGFGRGTKPAFRKRDDDSSERPRRSSGSFDRKGPGAEKPFARKSSFGSRPDSGSRFGKKPFQKRDSGGGEERPFRRSSSSFGSREDKPRFDKKPFQKRDSGSGEERPFKRRAGSFGSRDEKPSRFGKKPFQKRDSEGGEERPFRRSSGSFGAREDKPRFEKKPFQKRDSGSGEERPFKRSFGSRDDKPRFEKKPFQKRDSDSGEASPFKRKPRSFDSNDEKPARFTKKPFEGGEDGDKKVRKRFDSPEGDGEKKSFSRDGETRGTDKPFRKDSSNYGLPYKRKTFDRVRDVKSSKRTKAEDKPKSDSDLIRLNKFMANSGVGSRREADELIKMGLVTVNGETITEMGHKVKITDEVRYEGKKLKAEKPVYILLNKPKGFITTTDDPQERNTVMQLVAGAGKERIYPVGRLDRNTTGLLLITNDGDLADKLTHPSYQVKKIYRVELDKPLTKGDLVKIQEGVRLEEGRAQVDDVAIVDGDPKAVGIEIHIGWNRIVRRIFESLGYAVEKLDRVAYAGLDKKDLTRGQWRFLKPEEIIRLKHFK